MWFALFLPKITCTVRFDLFDEQVMENVRELLASTDASDVTATSTMIAGALTLGLSHINRRTMTWTETHGNSIVETAGATAGSSSTAAVSGGNACLGTFSKSDSDCFRQQFYRFGTPVHPDYE